MLSLYHAADLETLGEIATRLLAQPLQNPFAPNVVVVPSQGMGRWLNLQLARHQGIAMHIEIVLPARYVWDLSRLALGELPEQSAFAPATLTWRLYGWLVEPRNLARTPRLAHYLEGGDERRRLALADKIADVFDQYLLYRDDWLAAWERQELLNLGPDEHWQALLWHELTKDGHPHRARLLDELLARLFDPTPLAGLPERLLVFGISSLPPHHLRVLEGLAQHTDVVICALNPTREAWGDIRDIRELAREQSSESRAEEWYLDIGNPLLASLGKQGRDFFDSLFSLPLENELGIYSEDADLHDDSLLHALQNDILRLRTRAPAERLAWRPDDTSLAVHIAHSPLREVEILHDQLLARFAADPTLTPDQVVVLTPDIETYAPFISAVFSAREAQSSGAPRIPYSLADRSLRAETPLIETFLELLGLAESRFAAEDILAWLQQPAVALRAGLNEQDLPLIRQWLQAAGVHWGRDAAHRARLGLPANAAFSWRQGLDRLLLGFLAPPQLAGDRVPLLGEYWPLDALEGSRAQVLGHLIAFIERLGAWADILARPRPLADWASTLQELLQALFAEEAATETLLQLAQASAALREQASASGLGCPLPIELIRQQLSRTLEQGAGAVGFLTGAVTFCTMVPMRSLPFQLVCLLGLNDGVFPRRTPALGFDLVARHPRRGDRARRLDDRYLLLESLLSARTALYLSYVGRDPRDNAVLPPSVLVSEVLEAVDLTMAPEPEGEGRRASAGISFIHPLQPFSPENFGSGQQTGFSAAWFKAAQRLAAPPTPPEPFASPLTEPDAEWFSLEPGQLIRCLEHPARFFLEQRLGLYLPKAHETIAPDEPFELDWAASNQLRQLALNAFDHHWPETNERRVAQAAGWLPNGELGEVLWGQERGPIRVFASILDTERPQTPPQPLAVDLELAGLRVRGWLENVTESGLFSWKLNKPSGRDVIGLWIRHLLLNYCAPIEIACVSRLLTPDDDWQFGPIKQPVALLLPWLTLYRKALCEPLPLFAKTSLAFAQTLLADSTRSEKTPLEAARVKARALWEGNEHQPGEGSNPWNILAFRNQDTLTEHFEHLAEQLLTPLINARLQPKPKA